MKSNQTTGIHCKVICNDQIRRFQFSGTEFSSLQHQVNQLLGLNREFVLKYKDNENDMITISSTEELSCAIEISQKENRLFRLTVFLNEPLVSCPIPSIHTPIHPEHGRDFCHRGRGGWGGHGCHEGGPSEFYFEKRLCHDNGPDFSEHPWKGRFEKHCNRGPTSPEHPCKGRFEKRIEKLTFKRDMFKAYLSSLEQVKELSPEEERRKQMFQAKVQHLDSILARFSPPKDNHDVPSEKPDSCLWKESEKPNFCPPKHMYHCKFEKRARKWEKKEHKKEAKNSDLSEEAKAEIITLKSQIKEMKPAIWAIQEQLKNKKSAIRDAFEVGQHAAIPELRNEIWRLKQEKRALKQQIEPLRQRFHQLKGGK
jgi:hypothetical protein